MTEELANDTTTVIEVDGEATYPILVGRGLLDCVPALLGPQPAKILIVHSAAVGRVAEDLRDALQPHYGQVLLAEVPDDEPTKRIEVASFCWQILGQAEFTRTDAVISIGGGVVVDLAGFVASAWQRGLRLVQIPTTVLAMVEVAIGGENGVNTAEGKNAVGTLYPPAAVVCDVDLAVTLTRAEILTAFAEIAKCGFIAEPEILELLESDLERTTDPSTPEFRRAIELAIRVKARALSHGGGGAELLHYGYALGRAIEHAERYQWRHGAALALGMMYAAELGRMTGALSDAAVERHRKILSSLSLPLTYPAGRWSGLLAMMQRGAQAGPGMLRFVVLDDIAKPRVLTGVDDSMLQFAYQEVSS